VLGALLGALVLAIAAAGVVVLTVGDGWGLPASSDQPVDLVAAVGFALAGALVLLAGSSDPRLGWLLVGAGAADAVGAFCTAAASVSGSPGPVTRALALSSTWVWVLGLFPLLTLLPLIYPDGRLPGPRWRVVVATSVAGTLAFAVGCLLAPESFVGRTTIAKPYSSRAATDVLVAVSFVLLVPSVVAALTSLLLRLRRANGLLRRRVAVLLVAAALLVVELVLQQSLPTSWRTPAQALAVALLPAAVAVAVTPRRLLDLDVVLTRVMVAVSLLVCLAGLALTAYAVLHAVLGRPGPAAVGAAGLTGFAAHPLGRRLARASDRLLFGERANPHAVTRRLAALLRGGVAPADVPAVIEGVLREVLHLQTVSLLLRDEPASGPGVEVVELVHRGDVVGRLVATPRPGEGRLDERDRAVLESVAEQVAPTVSSVRAYADLRASREALVAARESERHRLRRDLHDGVGAALAGVRLQLDSARVRVDDARTGRLLDAAEDGVRTAIDDVRRVTDDLRPAGLDELGLAGTLESLCRRATSDALHVDCDLPVLPALPPAVEVACYRIATEALANVVRHAGASRARLSLAVTGRLLRLEVADDGRGLPTQPRPGGLGLASIRQRAEEVGGRATIGAGAAGGVVVVAELPVDLA
jgi:signal transduction histidine kinase